MYKFTLIFALAVCLLVPSSQTLASKEGILALSKFSLESSGIGSSGVINVSGTQANRGIVTLRIEAFGKSFNLSSDELSELTGFSANGIQISYEGGYKDMGGRTLYVVFTRGLTSGLVGQRYVSVTESGLVRVKNRP